MASCSTSTFSPAEGLEGQCLVAIQDENYEPDHTIREKMFTVRLKALFPL
jgi:hypothetical protein